MLILGLWDTLLEVMVPKEPIVKSNEEDFKALYPLNDLRLRI